MKPAVIGPIAIPQSSPLIVEPFVEIIYDDINNSYPVLYDLDISAVSSWNNFLVGAGGEEQVPFTSVEIDGNKVTLRGGANLYIQIGAFNNNIHIVSFINNQCYTSLADASHHQGCFSGCIALQVIKFLSSIAIPNETFRWPDVSSSFTLMDFRGATNEDLGFGAFGPTQFSGINANTITLIIPVTISNSDISLTELKLNNTVTILNPA